MFVYGTVRATLSLLYPCGFCQIKCRICWLLCYTLITFSDQLFIVFLSERLSKFLFGVRAYWTYKNHPAAREREIETSPVTLMDRYNTDYRVFRNLSNAECRMINEGLINFRSHTSQFIKRTYSVPGQADTVHIAHEAPL